MFQSGSQKESSRVSQEYIKADKYLILEIASASSVAATRIPSEAMRRLR